MRHTFKTPGLAAIARLASRLGARMGYVDAQQLYSDAQALVATAASTNIIDHGQDRNFGVGTPMALVVGVDVAAAGGGTLTIALQADDNSGFSSPGTAATTAALAAAALVAGAIIVLPVPPDINTERFSRVNFTLVTMTSITVTAYLCPMDQVPVVPQYAAGTTVNN